MSDYPHDYHVTIDLYRDWLNTVKEVFRGSGHPLDDSLSDEEVAFAYYRQTASSDEDADRQSSDNEQRLKTIQQTILDRLDDVIAPDIKLRTGYEENRYHFQWVFNQGEHIVENCSSYRIPL